MKKSFILGIIAILIFTAGQICFAKGKVLKIATRQSPPFSYQDNNGVWKGISIELWQKIAKSNNYKYTFEDTTLNELLEGVRNGKYDVGVAGITITSDREKFLDFSQPFISSTIGVASIDDGSPWLKVFNKFISLTFLKILLMLVAVLLLAGIGVWFFERKKNEEFSGKPHSSLASAFWWAAVTMTTVGYGDKSPRTPGGRIVGLLWMFVSVIILTSFTAAIVSSLTIESAENKVTLNTLRQGQVATVPNSVADVTLKKFNIAPVNFQTCKDMFEALSNGKVDYVIYDLPVLRYYGTKYGSKFSITAVEEYRQDFGLAFRLDSPLENDVDVELLRIVNTPAWRNIITRYLGNWTSDLRQ